MWRAVSRPFQGLAAQLRVEQARVLPVVLVVQGLALQHCHRCLQRWVDSTLCGVTAP